MKHETRSTEHKTRNSDAARNTCSKTMLHASCFMSNSRRGGKGFTTIELLITVAILATVAVVTADIFASHYLLFGSLSTTLETERSGFLAIENIRGATLGARRILGAATINGVPYSSGTSTLILELPAVDISGNLLPALYDTVVLYRDPTDQTKLWTETAVAVGSARQTTKRLLSDFVQDLIFLYNNNTVSSATQVDVSLIVSRATRATTPETPLSLTIDLRNP